MISNSLVISGWPEAVEEVRKLVNELDQLRGMVLVDMEIGEAPATAAKEAVPAVAPEGKTSAAGGQLFLAEKPAHMEDIGRLQLTTLDNQAAFVHIGARVPRVTAKPASTTGSQPTDTVILDSVGLILKVTPRISPDGTIVMLINAVNSQLGPEEEGIPISVAADKVVRSPRIDSTEVYTTVQVRDGQTVVLGNIAREGKSNKMLVICVTSHILRPEETKAKP
jgi:type II secretory pathway component GspD/PulD (secretin)